MKLHPAFTPHRVRKPILLILLSLTIGFAGTRPVSSADFGEERSLPAWALRDDGLLRRRGEQLSVLGAAEWQARGHRGRGVKVAVLDSGFRGYRQHLGKALPANVTVRSFRDDGIFEARDSQHGILCGEVVHAIAPDAEILFANWEPDQPESFLAAVRWARTEGARVITCSVISPAWSDGEGGGPIHRRLREVLGDGTAPGDVLCFASAGNVAQRHWSGDYRPGRDGWHIWSDDATLNRLRPWGTDDVSVELCWSDPNTSYRLEVVDPSTGKSLGRSISRPGLTCATVRFRPELGQTYAVRLRRERGPGNTFHLTALSSGLDLATERGSIPFPGDGPEVIAVGAVDVAGHRATYSACGPNSAEPKPDLVAPIPFTSFWRSQPFAGTSAAAPQAAALAALLWSRHGDWPARRVRTELTAGASDLGLPGHDVEFGFGRIHLPNLGRASGTGIGVTTPVK
jgi:subtilisin family serine protease